MSLNPGIETDFRSEHRAPSLPPATLTISLSTELHMEETGTFFLLLRVFSPLLLQLYHRL